MKLELIELVQQNLETLKLDPCGEIKPFNRLQIYNALDLNFFNDFKFFTILQIITTKYVLPFWSLVGKDNLPLYLLDLAERVFQQKLSVTDVEQEFYQVGNDLEMAEILSTFPNEAFAVACAAYDTLRLVIYGFNKWQDHIIYADDTNDDLPMWGNDSAKWASIAISGWIIDTTTSTKQKRREFWEWWLMEAIPQAWQLAQESQ